MAKLSAKTGELVRQLPWRRYLAAPVTHSGHDSGPGDKVSTNSIGNKCIADGGISTAVSVPWRQLLDPAKYLSSSTQFVVFDKDSKKWLFRLDKSCGKGAKYPHMNVNHLLTSVRDLQTRIPGALVRASGPIGKVVRNAKEIASYAVVGYKVYKIGYKAWTKTDGGGGAADSAESIKAGAGDNSAESDVFAGATAGTVIQNTEPENYLPYAAIGIDVYRIGLTAWTEVAETGYVGAETVKVVAGVSGAWTGGFAGATLGGKVGIAAGGLVAGPVGAGVCGIVGAVAGGIGGSIKGRMEGSNLVERQTQSDTSCEDQDT